MTFLDQVILLQAYSTEYQGKYFFKEENLRGKIMNIFLKSICTCITFTYTCTLFCSNFPAIFRPLESFIREIEDAIACQDG